MDCKVQTLCKQIYMNIMYIYITEKNERVTQSLKQQSSLDTGTVFSSSQKLTAEDKNLLTNNYHKNKQ